MEKRTTRVVILKDSKVIAEIEKGTDLILAKMEDGVLTMANNEEIAVGYTIAKDHQRARYYKALVNVVTNEYAELGDKYAKAVMLGNIGAEYAKELENTIGLCGWRAVREDLVQSIVSHLKLCKR